MLQSKGALIYVDSTRNKGVSKKTGNEYDMALIEVSDGIASQELPLEPNIQADIEKVFRRGDKVQIEVDVKKAFGRASFIVSKVTKAS